MVPYFVIYSKKIILDDGLFVAYRTPNGNAIFGFRCVQASTKEEALEEGKSLFPEVDDIEVVGVADDVLGLHQESLWPLRHQLHQLPLKGKKSRKGTSGRRRRRRRSAATMFETEKKE
jgi:hypothetical protein